MHLDWSLCVHGGAGLIGRARLTPEREARCRAALREALTAGGSVLRDGGHALDAVIAATRVLEDDAVFNAGRGAVLNERGEAELDASIMDGATGRAGAVASLRTIRSPILAARSLLEDGVHVLQSGPAAEAWLRARGLETAPPSWFVTDERLRQWSRARQSHSVQLDHDGASQTFEPPDDEADVYGTVGAVARDRDGRLAAATSTGGMTNKRVGRISDSAIIGSGTWADETVAVSGTGHGEFFIRTSAASRIAHHMRWGEAALDAACEEALDAVANAGGSGGIIAIDASGRVAMPFNTAGMFRGCWTSGSKPITGVFGDE